MSTDPANSDAAAELRIYHRLQLTAHRLQKAADRALLDAAGLTAAQAAVLTLVHAVPDTTQRALARRLGFNESAITALVGRLEASGALARRRHPEDGRVRVLSVTADGLHALERAHAAFRSINAAIAGATGGDELAAFAATLDKLGAAFLPPAEE